ncbi:DUF1648 domain-containing protein [Luteibaculum oceani]|uniref:DUF1648 domain-containing protein n=1 Tax=Luteibaculum oceani TaxID=1294296 RepID=A0A5C6US12_9FLAO|nr:DUF1648 domain-containing protein [Luteibaculum oceani]TXC76113.1 DUF1648 domain-containing protein [Luteibaculum oceani]
MFETENRPPYQFRYPLTDKLLDISCLALAISSWLYLFYHYGSIPAKVPMHFNAAGEITRYGVKAELFILTVVATAVAGGLVALAKYPRIYNYPVEITAKNAQKQYNLATRMVRVMNLLVTTLLCYATFSTIQISISNKNKLSPMVIYILVAAVFALIIGYLILANKKNKD